MQVISVDELVKYQGERMLDFETIKELFKKAIDNSDTMNEAISKLLQYVYEQGKKDADQPSRKGHWLQCDTMGLTEVEKIECSECGESVVKGMGIKTFIYCPWCGADMREQTERDENEII